ncbi:MAG: hypothetical protein R3E12_18750 [Candidatus Eisenbacteria bacterium]
MSQSPWISPPNHRPLGDTHHAVTTSEGAGPDVAGPHFSRLPQWSRAAWLSVFLVAWLLPSGCSDDKGSTAPVPDPPPGRTTITGIFQGLVYAYQSRDLDHYKLLFDQSDFQFVFDEQDATEDPDIPESWGWPEEQTSTRNMFESDLVERIQLDFVQGTPVLASETDVRERPFPEGTMKVTISDVDLSVDTRDPQGGENIIFKVTGDKADFFLYQDLSELQDGLPVWKIFEWRDFKLGPRGSGFVLETSWGVLKSAWE